MSIPKLLAALLLLCFLLSACGSPAGGPELNEPAAGSHPAAFSCLHTSFLHYICQLDTFNISS